VTPDFARQVYDRVPAYRAFLAERGASPDTPWQELPCTDKPGYLLAHPLADLCWDGSLASCHLIGCSSGFSKTGSIFWPKRPEDERGYVDGIAAMLAQNYGIDRKRTLILVSLAFGTWIGGMQLATACRTMAVEQKHPVTVALPSLNLAEAVEIYGHFGADFEQVLWITNPSNIQLILALMARAGLAPKPGQISFPVVGEYFTEAFREWVADKFGHPADAPYVVWTGYGSADTGDLGVETAETIRLRKHFHRNPEACQAVFGTDSAPMLLVPSERALLEVIDGNLVCTKDQLIPLVRYDTRDAGGILAGTDLGPGAPAKVLYVLGRASDSVIFYGTNLRMADLSDHLLGEPDYAGFFTVSLREREGVETLSFTVSVRDEVDRAAHFQRSLVNFLKSRSREFATKYEALSASAGEPLIRVKTERLKAEQGQTKHRYLLESQCSPT